ncbi:hypothetical protein [Geodermatophilus sp. SYSU D00079]
MINSTVGPHDMGATQDIVTRNGHLVREAPPAASGDTQPSRLEVMNVISQSRSSPAACFEEPIADCRDPLEGHLRRLAVGAQLHQFGMIVRGHP